MNHIFFKEDQEKDFYDLRRIPIFIYAAQLKKIDEICQKRNKTRRIVFFEAFQTYISLFDQGEV